MGLCARAVVRECECELLILAWLTVGTGWNTANNLKEKEREKRETAGKFQVRCFCVFTFYVCCYRFSRSYIRTVCVCVSGYGFVYSNYGLIMINVIVVVTPCCLLLLFRIIFFTLESRTELLKRMNETIENCEKRKINLILVSFCWFRTLKKLVLISVQF